MTDPTVNPVLTVPAEASFVSTVRIFAGAIGRQEGLDDERVDDLKLVVSEVAAGLIGDGRHGPDARLVVEIGGEGPALLISCRGPASTTRDGEDPATEHRRRLLEAIVPDARWVHDGDEQIVTFSLGS